MSTLAESFDASLMICVFDGASLAVDGASLASLAFAVRASVVAEVSLMSFVFTAWASAVDTLLETATVISVSAVTEAAIDDSVLGGTTLDGVSLTSAAFVPGTSLVTESMIIV